MKIKALLIFVFGMAATVHSQEKINGNGNVSTKNVKTTEYSKIAASGFFDVELISGNEGNIVIEGEENLLEFITVEVDGNTLKISNQKGKKLKVSAGKRILINVPFQTIDEVNLSGSGNVTSKSIITSPQFSTALTGSGDVDLNVDSESLTAKVTGSGNLKLHGKANVLQCKVTGSGDFDAYNCKSSNVDVSVTGSGNCNVSCDNSLTARISGSGDINYKGEPIKKDAKVSGSGSISKT